MSIGNVSATISANAQQFISEFGRADNEARRKTAAISASIDKLQGDVRKKFSVGQIGTSVLSGLGIGSGFAIAEKAAEQVLNYFKQAAEAAQRIEESSTRALNAFRERIQLNQTDEQKLQAATRERLSLEKQLAQDDKLLNQAAAITDKGRGAAASRMAILSKTLSAEAREKLRAEIEEAKLLEAKLTKIDKAKDLSREEADEKARIELITWEITRQEELRNKSMESGLEIIKKQKLEAKELADAQVEYARKYGPDYKAIKEIGDVEAPDLSQWTQYQESMFSIFDSIGDRSAATFSQMVLTGENALDSLLQSVADAFLQLTFRMGVVNPLLNAAFGLTGSSILPAFFGVGAGKASGGPVEGGMLYRVNENGPEYFRPNANGTIIPADRIGNGGGGGVHYSIDARGASVDAVRELRNMMLQLNASVEPRAVAAVKTANKTRK